jgi:hypothetical protein
MEWIVCCRLPTTRFNRERADREPVLFVLPSGFDGHGLAGRGRIHGRDGDHRSFRPSGGAGRRCGNVRTGDGVLALAGSWAVTATSLRRRDVCTPSCEPKALIEGLLWIRPLID